MPGALLTLLKNWRVILPIFAALCLGGFLFYQHAMLEKERRRADEMTREAYTLRNNLEAIQRLSKAQEAAIIKNQEKEQQNDSSYQKIRSDIEGAGESANAPAAPVLSGAIDSLRKHQLEQ